MARSIRAADGRAGHTASLIEWYRPQRGLDEVEVADAVVKIAFDGLRR